MLVSWGSGPRAPLTRLRDALEPLTLSHTMSRLAIALPLFGLQIGGLSFENHSAAITLRASKGAGSPPRAPADLTADASSCGGASRRGRRVAH